MVPRALRPAARRLSTAAGEYKRYHPITTRWFDNDGFGHVNNMLYYGMMDDAINAHLLEHGFGYEHPRFVAESSCRYMRPIAYPQPVEVGLRVAKLGTSSCQYELGIFGVPHPNAKTAALMVDTPPERFLAATGAWTHVYVDREGKPKAIDDAVRTALQALAV